MTKNNFDEIRDIISSHDNFLIFTHDNPDGDALGSTCAMLNILLENGKKAKLLIPEKIPSKYLDLVPRQGIINSIGKDDLNSNYSYCLSIDLPRAEKAAIGELKINDIKIPFANIDHHIDNKGFGTTNLIIPEAAAAAEIVYNIFEGMPSWKISAASATYLLIGVIMDTGCYRFHNTSPDTFEISAKLMQAGARHVDIINRLFFSRPLDMMKLEADILLNHLNFECGGRFAWAYLSDELLAKYNTDVKNVEGLIDLLRSVEGTEVVALLSKRDTVFKISLRSKNSKYSVGKIARMFGGGGHELAAGGFFEGLNNVEEAGKLLVKNVEKLLNEEI
jgi:phosphoesterase RecJ-like protein